MEKEKILNILECFKRDNQKKYNILKIGIFGSAARETDSSRSDIDVVVVHDQFSFYIIKITVSDYAYANPTYLLL